jgi:propanediol dehydratase large subunit
MKTLDQVNSKIFNSRVDWKSIKKELALKNTHSLDLLREACLIESYLPVYTGKMNELFWDNIAATSIFTIEAFEAYGHYFILRRYLEIVGYRPVTDEEVIALREKDKDKIYTDKVKELVNFMGTEHFAAEFFKDLAKLTDEPVLKSILPRFSAEEVNHSQFAFDLLENMIRQNSKIKEKVLEYALQYQHIGAYIMPQVSPAKEDNIKVIQSFNEKIGRLIGKRLSEALA